MQKTLRRVGVVGGGRATLELTLPVLKDVPGVVVAAVCDVNESTAKLLSEKFNVPFYLSVEKMIHEESIDVVILNTPVATHADLAITAMKGGAHVFLEKPAVAKTEELDQIIKVSKETNRKFSVAHNYKFLDGPMMALKLIKQGKIGEVLHVDRVWMSPPEKDRMEMDKEGWWHKMPGGRLADALPHMLYLPFMFVGPMKLLAVSARKLATDRPWSVCDESDILLATSRAYVNIRQSINQKSWPYKGYTYHTVIYGSKRNMVVDGYRAAIIEGQSYRFKIIEGLDALLGYLRRKSFLEPGSESMRGAHNVIYRKFIEYVNDEGPNPSPEEEIRNVVELTEQISMKMQEAIDTHALIIKGQ